MPDINSPPLAVTYPMHTTPYMIHASPISPLPCTEYEPVKLSPGPPAPMFLDSNSIPFYITEMPRSPLINSKLAPVAGSFITISNDPADISSPLASDTSTSNTTEFAKTKIVTLSQELLPQPRQLSSLQGIWILQANLLEYYIHKIKIPNNLPRHLQAKAIPLVPIELMMHEVLVKKGLVLGGMIIMPHFDLKPKCANGPSRNALFKTFVHETDVPKRVNRLGSSTKETEFFVIDWCKLEPVYCDFAVNVSTRDSLLYPWISNMNVMIIVDTPNEVFKNMPSGQRPSASQSTMRCSKPRRCEASKMWKDDAELRRIITLFLGQDLGMKPPWQENFDRPPPGMVQVNAITHPEEYLTSNFLVSQLLSIMGSWNDSK
ncbi:hypothetical protein GGU11DRAFT_759037 [Lentinula aff. detonsa]|nr:hypothetical protein GGU11DRAFT_759037 [Lentinula aff. detonsa]